MTAPPGTAGCWRGEASRSWTGHYAPDDGLGGVYQIKGEKIYFDLGELDGKQIRILSTGRLKYSSDIFCVFSSSQDEFIPETPQPDVPPGETPPAGNSAAPPVEPAPVEPKPAEPVPPKLIKVDPNQTDPRVQPVAP